MDGTMRNRRGVNLQRDSRASNSWLLNDCEEAEQIQSTINSRSGNTNTTQNSSSSAVSFPIPILTYEDLCQFCSSLLDSLKEFIMQTFSFSNTTPSISPKTQSLMDDFKKFGTTGYDSTNPIHEKTLQKYWDLCCPEKTLISRKSEQWKTLGFQGTDPATDFRGAGIFGLRCLVYFAITYPRAFDNLRNVEKSSQQEMYPFSIAGLNIVMIIFEFLGWGFKRIPQHPTAQRNLIRLLFETHCDVNIPILEDSVTPREPEKPVDIVPDLLTGAAVVPVKTHTKDLLKFDFDGDFDDGWTVIEEEDENSVEVVQEDAPRENNDMSLFNFKNSSTEKMFYELFCYSFIQLHENWFARDCVAYMDFPVVLTETTDKLRGLLIADSFTVQSLQAFLQTHNS